jgi:hypothetical protein
MACRYGMCGGCERCYPDSDYEGDWEWKWLA